MRACSTCKYFLPESYFSRDGASLKGQCKACKKNYMAAYIAARPGYGKAVYKRHKRATRSRTLLRKYGITQEGYESLLRDQDEKCAICGDAESNQHHGVFHVDHCHKTGRIRGLLCRGCNHILGTVKDSPEILFRAIEYLAASADESPQEHKHDE